MVLITINISADDEQLRKLLDRFKTVDNYKDAVKKHAIAIMEDEK